MKKLGAILTTVAVGLALGAAAAHADSETGEQTEPEGALELVGLALERITCFSCAI